MKNTVFPDRAFVKLPYVDSFTLSGSVAGYVDTTFDLASVYDPNTTGTGHQPRGLDQWTATYNKYRVHGCKVELALSQIDIDSAATYSTVVGSCLSSSSVGSGGATPILDLLEGPQAQGFFSVRWRTQDARAAGFAADMRRHTRKFYAPIRPWLRKISFANWTSQTDVANLYTAVNANPANSLYFSIFMGNQTGSDDSGFNLTFIIKLTYYVEFTDLDFFAES